MKLIYLVLPMQKNDLVLLNERLSDVETDVNRAHIKMNDAINKLSATL